MSFTVFAVLVGTFLCVVILGLMVLLLRWAKALDSVDELRLLSGQLDRFGDSLRLHSAQHDEKDQP